MKSPKKSMPQQIFSLKVQNFTHGNKASEIGRITEPNKNMIARRKSVKRFAAISSRKKKTSIKFS